MSIVNRLANEIQNCEDNPSYLLNKYNLKEAVKLPFREDPKEWIANNLFDFHKQICMLYGTINCTDETCPKMTAGKKYEFLWSLGEKTVELSASKYIHHLLDWVQEQLDDGDIFPSISVDKEFPPNYMDICKTIAKRLSRVFSHLYHHHLVEVRMLQIDAYMNTSLKHFIYFTQEFELVTIDLDPLKEYIQSLTDY